MATVFISYSRKDLAAALDLQAKLKQLGHESWLDLEDLPAASRWREEVIRAMEHRDVFLFALSPDSIASEECRKELEHALQLGKRLVPVVIRDLPPAAADSRLGDIDWVFLRPGDDVGRGCERLAAAIAIDLDHLHQHTRFLIPALEWERHPGDRGLLLRGASLREARGWLAASGGKKPVPAPLIWNYVAASRKAERQRIAWRTLVAVLVLAVSITAVVVARLRRETARSDLSRRLARDATTSAALDLALLYAVAAHEAAPSGDAAAALLSGLERAPQLRTILHEGQGEIWALAFHPHAPLLASAGEGGTIYLWNTRDWTRRGVIATGEGHVSALAFAGRGDLLWSGDWDGRLRLWDPASGKEVLPPLAGRRGLVEALALAPDGRYAVVGYTQGALIWDLGTTPPRSIAVPIQDRRVPEAAFDRSGHRLALLQGTDSVVWWDFAGGSLSNRQDRHLGAGFTTLAWHPDGKTLVFGQMDGTISWWRTDGTAAEAERREAGHDGKAVMSLAFSDDGSLLASAGRDGGVRIWDERGLASPLSFARTGAVFKVGFQPGTPLLASAGADAVVYVWDSGLNQPLARLLRRSGNLQKLIYAPDGRTLFAGTLDGLLLRVDLTHPGRAERIPVEDGDLISGLAIHGNELLWSGAGGLFGLWDLAAGRGETLPHQPAPVSAVAMRTDGTVFAIGGEDGQVSLWRRHGRSWVPSPLRVQPASKEPLSLVLDLAFSPDGMLLVAGDNTGHALAWDVGSGHALRSWTVPVAALGLSFSPDGRQLAVCNGGDGEITLLDPRRKEVPKPVSGTCHRVFSVAFRHDGRMLITGCDDGSIEQLEAGSGRDLGRLRAYGEFVYGLASSPTEDVMASATSDGWLLLWDLDEASWERRACRRAGRDLPDAIPGWTGPPPRRCESLLEGASAEPSGLRLDLTPDTEDMTRAIALLPGLAPWHRQQPTRLQPAVARLQGLTSHVSSMGTLKQCAYGNVPLHGSSKP